jgi:hypothetical protein
MGWLPNRLPVGVGGLLVSAGIAAASWSPIFLVS